MFQKESDRLIEPFFKIFVFGLIRFKALRRQQVCFFKLGDQKLIQKIIELLMFSLFTRRAPGGAAFSCCEETSG